LRRRQLRSVAAIAAIAALFYFTHERGQPTEPEKDRLPLPQNPPVAEPAEPEYRLSRALLGRGGTLDSGLEKLGIPWESRPELIEALGVHLDLRRLSPETGLSVARDAGGTLLLVACRPDLESYVRVTLTGDSASEAEPVPVPVRSTVKTAGGIIESTVFHALSDLPDSTFLTLTFADIFQWDVDLFVDPRPGDRVRVVYESRHLALPPADLPPFGKSGTQEGAYLGVGRILAASYDGERARSTAYWVEDDGNSGSYYDNEGRSLRKTFLKSPLNYRRISSAFTHRRRHPITRKIVPHHGVDFAADFGTPVVAAADGRVVSAGWQGALGKAVRIRHGNSFTTTYGHLRGFARGIRKGAVVEQNKVIGYVGSTGRATGPHLHYTLSHHGRAINPMTFENPSAEPLDHSLFPRLESAKRIWMPALRSIHLGPMKAAIFQPPTLSEHPDPTS